MIENFAIKNLKFFKSFFHSYRICNLAREMFFVSILLQVCEMYVRNVRCELRQATYQTFRLYVSLVYLAATAGVS